MDDLALKAFPFLEKIKKQTDTNPFLKEICINRAKNDSMCCFASLAGHMFACALVNVTTHNFEIELSKLIENVDVGCKQIRARTVLDRSLKNASIIAQEIKMGIMGNQVDKRFPFILKFYRGQVFLENLPQVLEKIIDGYKKFSQVSTEDIKTENYKKEDVIILEEAKETLEEWILEMRKKIVKPLPDHILQCYNQHFSSEMISPSKADPMGKQVIDNVINVAKWSGIWENNVISDMRKKFDDWWKSDSGKTG